MSILDRVPELQPLQAKSDHWDVYQTSTNASLREVIAALLEYNPWWVRWLFRIRGVVAWLLRLKHDDEQPALLAPEEVPFAPGEPAGFFTVREAEEGRYWVAEAADHHLAAQLGVVAEPCPYGAARYHLVTFVQYRDWTGPLYFNLIRPFHHLIIYSMARWLAHPRGAFAAAGPSRREPGVR